MLCKDSADNHSVVIENQIWKIHHSHLGQIPTNAADLEAINKIIDDGDLSLGRFRLAGNGRYTFLLEDR